MKQKNQSAVLSYYGLYLLQYLKENHPDKTADTDFIAVRDELASDPYGKPAMVYKHDGGVYVRKALAFVRKMLKHIARPHSQVPPLSSIPSKDEKKNDMPVDIPMRWTGKAFDLVEILYGMAEMGCINDGKITVGELAAFFYSLFNVEAKDCYRIYSDLKLRKNDSRTYFLDKMQEKLNKRMDMDEERERTRR